MQRPDRQEGRRHRRVARPTPPPWPRRSQDAKAAGIPVLTWDSDLLPTRTRTCASPMSARTTTRSASTSPSSCRRSSRRAARSASSRAAPRRPTTTSACRASATRSPARRATTSPGDRLTGQNGWTEVDGCPLYTNDDFPLSVQQMEDILGKYPEARRLHPDRRLPAVHPARLPRSVAEKYKDTDRQRRAGPRRRRHAAGADRPDEGRPVDRPGRPAAVRDGLQGDVLPEGHQGRQAGAGRPDLYRPRRLHAGDRRHLHRASSSPCDASGAYPGALTAADLHARAHSAATGSS